MTSIEDLAALQAPTPVDALERLTALLDLARVGLRMEAVRIFGRGASAPIELDLSNGEMMTFEQLREMARPANLAAELVACGGPPVAIKAATALQAVALARQAGERSEVLTENDGALDWGAGFLQLAETLPVDLGDQQQRWAAFCKLGERDPYSLARAELRPYAACCIVLRHIDGSRLVRCEWFARHVKEVDAAIPGTRIAGRMARVGWQRRGKSGRVKATRPGYPGTLGWAFHIVPPDWPAGSEVPTGGGINARANGHDRSRVSSGTWRNPGEPGDGR